MCPHRSLPRPRWCAPNLPRHQSQWYPRASEGATAGRTGPAAQSYESRARDVGQTWRAARRGRNWTRDRELKDLAARRGPAAPAAERPWTTPPGDGMNTTGWGAATTVPAKQGPAHSGCTGVGRQAARWGQDGTTHAGTTTPSPIQGHTITARLQDQDIPPEQTLQQRSYQGATTPCTTCETMNQP